MPALELTPNIEIIVGQAALFLVNLVVVKKFFLAPYMDLLHRRSESTVEKRQRANALVAQCSAATEKLEASLAQAHVDAKNLRLQIEREAEDKEVQLLERASREAKSLMVEQRQKIAKAFSEQQPEVPGAVARVVETLTRKVLEEGV